MNIVIEKNVPMPKRGLDADTKYPFAEMVDGDSFFVPCEKEKTESVRASVFSCAKYSNVNKITTRAVDGGIRVWCISREAK